uniref:Major capsid protein N-terminal domain-containing protein n=1 Tax=viral metagenome TaxID=1070528 RepID=A0A6C0B6Y7_9ZZZZ
MAGGLLNLISEGANNVIIHGGPSQKTMFRATYNKITNFGLQKFRIDYDGLRDLRLSEESKFSFKIPRYAELLMDTYIVITLPHIWSPIYHPCAQTTNRWAPYEFNWIKDIGTNIIKEIEIVCGNYTLQRYSGNYLGAMVERDFSATKKDLFNEMTGNVPEMNNPRNANGRSGSYPHAYFQPGSLGAEPSIRGRTLYIPINMWFTLDSKCAFPMAALQYNELHINITLRSIQELYQVRDVFDYTNGRPLMAPNYTQNQFQLYRFLQTPPSDNLDADSYENKSNGWNADIHILANYCFLSKEETRTFTSENQVYLIKDIIEHKYENVTGAKKIKIPSSGMVSNWMWYFQRNDAFMRNEWSNYTNWPYSWIPYDTESPNDIKTLASPYAFSYSPYQNQDSASSSGYIQTGYRITGEFKVANHKNILETAGILFNGEYRENLLTREVYDYVEKWTRTSSNARTGLYCYNFCLSSDSRKYQPSGAINMSKFKTIEIEVNTYVPPVNLDTVQYDVICNADGVVIATNSPGQGGSWFMYEYNYNMVLFEERYNVLSFVGGYCGLMYAR